jgi:ATP-dependent DNA ligase
LIRPLRSVRLLVCASSEVILIQANVHCERAKRPPEGREWRYELKLDGFRAIGRKAGRSAQLWSSNQKDFARRFPEVVKAIASLSSDTVN